MAKKLTDRMLAIAFIGTVLVIATGCPDYSHLRPVPDYENMTDSAGEGDSSESLEESE